MTNSMKTAITFFSTICYYIAIANVIFLTIAIAFVMGLLLILPLKLGLKGTKRTCVVWSKTF